MKLYHDTIAKLHADEDDPTMNHINNLLSLGAVLVTVVANSEGITYVLDIEGLEE